MNEFYSHRKIISLHGQDCYLSGCKTLDRDGKQEFLIIVSFNKPETAAVSYKKRWQIESLFRALKSSGFNIEDTHVTELERLEKLFLLTMIAFVWCYLIGDFLDKNIEEIKIKKHGRRAVSIFKHGLDYLSKVLVTGINVLNISIFKFLSCT
jgi:IS4 transposase